MSIAQTTPTTRLRRDLDAAARAQPEAVKATPLSLFARARAVWLATGRIDLGALATELGLGRATVFRWVGSREQLTGEVLWSITEPALKRAALKASGRGAARIAQICAAAVEGIVRFAPLRRFITDQPEYAVRLLTSKAGVVQGRVIASMRALLAEEAARPDATWRPPLDLDTLAWLVVRLCESFVYADVISDQQVASSDAGLAVQLLLSGQVEPDTAAAGV
jgi:hypothetical protein